MPRLPEIIAGNDPDVMEGMGVRPLQEAGYDEDGIRMLGEAVQEEVGRILRRAPASAERLVPDRIAFYHLPGDGDEGSNIMPQAHYRFDGTAISKLIGRSLGIGLAHPPQKLSDPDARETIRHELGHVLFGGAIDCSMSVSESFCTAVASSSIDANWHRPDQKTLTRGTCGLRTSDFSQARFGRGGEALVYRAAIDGLRLLTAEQILRICTGLALAADGRGTVSTFAEVADAMTAESPKASRILRHPSFTLLEGGSRTFVHQFSDDRATLFHLVVDSDPRYLCQAPEGGWHMNRWNCLDAQKPVGVTPTVKGKKLSEVEFMGRTPEYMVFPNVAEFLAQYLGVRKKDIQSIECRSGGLTFTLKPPRR